MLTKAYNKVVQVPGYITNNDGTYKTSCGINSRDKKADQQ